MKPVMKVMGFFFDNSSNQIAFQISILTKHTHIFSIFL